MLTKQLLCWSGMTDTEHSATSRSNEEEEEEEHLVFFHDKYKLMFLNKIFK